MKSKLIKFVISSLIIILSITSIFTYNSYKNRQSKIQQSINNKAQVEQTFRVIDKQSIVDKLNIENKLLCLSGEVTINQKFTNNNISDQDINLNFLHKWFTDSTSKDLNVSNTYKFNFTYDLRHTEIKIYNGAVDIKLSTNKLSINSVELSDSQAVERVGWLTSQFTPQQVNTLNQRVKDEAYNTIQSHKEYREQAINNVQNDIKDLLQGIVDKNTSIHFDVPNYDVVEQDVATIVK